VKSVWLGAVPQRVPVPVSPFRFRREILAVKSLLEVVENGKLVPGHDIAGGLGGDLSPDLAQGCLEDLFHRRVLLSLWTLPGELERLGDSRGRGDERLLIACVGADVPIAASGIHPG
jgi:hypothetical protein